MLISVSGSDFLRVSLGFHKIAVIGVGIMGSGIALACAKGGYSVDMWDIDRAVIGKAMTNISSTVDTLVDAKTLSRENANECLGRITSTEQMAKAVRDADLVFEVVPENIALKKNVLKKLDVFCQVSTILASNTSTFKISALASATKRRDRVIGTHWMNPPYLLPLVEVVPSSTTSTETTNAVKSFLTSIGKRPVMCKDTPGFIVNRIHSALLVEAISLVEKGIATMEDVDMVWTQHLGPRYCIVGPFQLLDSFGLDTEHSQYSYLQRTVKHDKFKPPKLLKTKVRNRQLGLKTGRGFYDYSGKDIQSIIKERDKRFIELLRFLGI
jgi:3-hydroxybutyryl-CoA dehydrogenase